MDTAVREISTPQPEVREKGPEIKPSNQGVESDGGFDAVESSEKAVLSALGIDDEVSNMPIEDQEKLQDVEKYVETVIEKMGLKLTQSSFNKALESISEDMGIDINTEPSVALDRISGVVRAWRNLSFISDPKEKRSLLMKLARMQTSKDMNKTVYDTMNKYEVWN